MLQCRLQPRSHRGPSSSLGRPLAVPLLPASVLWVLLQVQRCRQRLQCTLQVPVSHHRDGRPDGSRRRADDASTILALTVR